MSAALHHPLFDSNGTRLRRWWWWWLIIGFLFLCGTRVWAAAVTLAWDADTDPSITGYNVHFGTSSGTYTDVAQVNATTATLNNLFGNTTYYFTVTAVNTSGQEGAPSNEISTLTANTDLSNIIINSGALTPGFVANNYNYTVTVTNSIAALSIAPISATPGETVNVNGAAINASSSSNNVFLTTGNNVLTVTVTSPDESTTNTYTVDVTRLNVLQSWRTQYFGTSMSVGSAADLATPQNDGVPNLLKFATGMDPTVSGVMPGTLAVSGGSLAFTYVRVKAAVSDGTTCSAVWTDDLTSGSWSSDGVMESSVDQGTTDLVTDLVPVGASGRRFVRLVVSHP
jgi:multisubunit Na+/H+ antiporter MnhE subunit